MSILDSARAAGDAAVRFLHRLAWLPPLAARIAVGWVLAQSGWRHLANLDGFRSYFHKLGIPLADLQAPMAGGTELVCGGLVIVGLFTRLASVPLMVVMAVAIITAKRDEITEIGDLFGFFEFLAILLLLWLAIAGPGAISLDRLLFRPRSSAPVKPAA